jgi:hypothetical protein
MNSRTVDYTDSTVGSSESTYLYFVSFLMLMKLGRQDFSDEVQRRCENMMKLHTIFSFWKECRGRRAPIDNIGTQVWYGPEEQPNYVRLIDTPNTLAYEIVRRRNDIPRYGCNLEIVGDVIHYDIDYKPFVGDDLYQDDEDCRATMDYLPVVQFDSSKHFAKLPTYNEEIDNLLKCRGSPYIVQLLGRSEEATPRLVFEKHPHDILMAAAFNRGKDAVFKIKEWMLQIIDGVAFSHSLGLIHRDLVARNILVAKLVDVDSHLGNDADQANPVVLCDLQCRHASVTAPEVCRGGAFTPASDIYSLGWVLWQLCYRNNPIDILILQDFPSPAPFEIIFNACMKDEPDQRPTLQQLKGMLVDLVVDGYN